MNYTGEIYFDDGSRMTATEFIVREGERRAVGFTLVGTHADYGGYTVRGIAVWVSDGLYETRNPLAYEWANFPPETDVLKVTLRTTEVSEDGCRVEGTWFDRYYGSSEFEGDLQPFEGL